MGLNEFGLETVVGLIWSAIGSMLPSLCTAKGVSNVHMVVSRL